MAIEAHVGNVGLHPSGIVCPQFENVGAVETVQVKVLVQVLVCPQAVAVNVNTCCLLHELPVTGPASHVTGTAPHSLLAVTVPPNGVVPIVAHVGNVGLQPNGIVCPQFENVGAVETVHVKVRVQVLVCPQAVAVNVNTCCLLHELPVTGPASHVTGTAPHSLLAVTAPPNGCVPLAIEAHVGNVGLHPSGIVCPQFENVGAVETVQVKVLVQVLVCPQAVAVNVNTCCLLHELPVTGPASHVTGTAPHSLLAVTVPPNGVVPIVAHVGNVGLQPNGIVCPQFENVGAVETVHVKVRVQVLVCPQAVAVNVNTCCLLHEVPVTCPASHVTGTAPHSLFAVTAPPNGAVPIVAHVGNVGLHPNGIDCPQFENTGAVEAVHVKVRVQVLVCPHAVAVNVNICCLLHDVPVICPASHVTGTAPHSLFAVTAPPNGAVPIVAHVGNVGLHPNGIDCPQLENTGAVETVHVNVRVQVLVCPHAVAVNVNICCLLHDVPVTCPA